MKTAPMEHQKVGCALMHYNPQFYALAAEQGTGKTWMLLSDAEQQFVDGRINALLVIAPKGVHNNWVVREIPKHLSVQTEALAWRSNRGVKFTATLKRFLIDQDPEKLKVLSMNIDALNTNDGKATAEQFLMRHEAMMIIDESSRIKNPSAGRTKNCIKLGKLAKSRRIASGTMITGGPIDAFAQFEFLASARGLLGTRSYRAFVAEYAVLMPEDSGLVGAIAARGGMKPQIIQRDQKGNPKFQNLDKLRGLMEPYTYRVLKRDCLDLPDKIYKIAHYELEPKQMKVYEKLLNELIFEREDGQLDRFTALTKLIKLRQAVSGFVMVDGQPVELLTEHPRLQLFKELVQDIDGQFIVWATFREELAQVAAALKAMGIATCEYHGGVNDADREKAVDGFQSGEFRAFVGQAQSGGIGLTLTAAEEVIYYSSDFSLENRLQSEDRCHRIGTKHAVVYTDLAALGTIDERIAESLQMKSDVAGIILDGR